MTDLLSQKDWGAIADLIRSVVNQAMTKGALATRKLKNISAGSHEAVKSMGKNLCCFFLTLLCLHAILLA